MKTTIPSALQTHYDQGQTTTAFGVKITRQDGAVYAFTSAGEDATVDGVLYRADNGIVVSGIATTSGFAVDNLEMQTVDDGTVYTQADVQGGKWRNASFLFIRYNWAAPADGGEPLLAGVIGNVEIRQGVVVAEFRGLQQYLQQPIGSVTSKTCRANFADFPAANGANRCRLTAATYTRAGTVSAVTSRQVFTATALWTAEPTADYYGEGVLTWTGGLNNGLRIKVKTYVASGVITLMLPMASAVQVGDTFNIVAGCRKRLAEDCAAKFSNVLNFAGEPHLPGLDSLTKAPTGAAS